MLLSEVFLHTANYKDFGCKLKLQFALLQYSWGVCKIEKTGLNVKGLYNDL